MRIVADILIAAGFFFALAGAKGVLQMPDAFCRMQASTCITTLGALGVMLGGALFGAVDSSEAASALSGTGVTQGEAGALAGIGGLLVVFAGVVELILGILGVRAANDNQKIMPVWILAIIEVILSAVSLGSCIFGGSFSTQGASTIISLLFAILIMWIANNIKREAGK